MIIIVIYFITTKNVVLDEIIETNIELEKFINTNNDVDNLVVNITDQNNVKEGIFNNIVKIFRKDCNIPIYINPIDKTIIFNLNEFYYNNMLNNNIDNLLEEINRLNVYIYDLNNQISIYKAQGVNNNLFMNSILADLNSIKSEVTDSTKRLIELKSSLNNTPIIGSNLTPKLGCSPIPNFGFYKSPSSYSSPIIGFKSSPHIGFSGSPKV
jgi:hypothetical protein